MITVTGELLGEAAFLEWDDGVIDGSAMAVADLREVKGEIRPHPLLPTVTNPDVTQPTDFVVAAVSVLGMDAEVEGYSYGKEGIL